MTNTHKIALPTPNVNSCGTGNRCPSTDRYGCHFFPRP
jgi:hypothetical protein